MAETDRTKVIVYYAVWATVCAAAAGAVLSLVHTGFFSYYVGRSGFLHTLVSDLEVALAIAAGQGAVALVTAGILSQLGRALGTTVLLGLVLGVFDFLFNFVQMVFPKTELGWRPDLIILAVAAAAITAIGARKALATS